MKGSTAIGNQSAGVYSAKPSGACQIPHTGGAIIDLADEDLISQVDEKAVFQHTRKIIDAALEVHWISDPALKAHIEHKVALICHHGPITLSCC